MEAFAFTLFSSIAIASALLMILQRHMVYSVGLMIIVLISIGGLFLTLNAQFLFFVQIIVYAGAVMVFFVFTAMMIGRQDIELFTITSPQFWIALVIVSLLLFQLGIYVGGMSPTFGQPGNYSVAVDGGNPIQFIGKRLFTDYIVALQGVGALILVALVGAIYVSRDPESHVEDASSGSATNTSISERTST